MQENNNLSTSIWEITTQQNTKHPKWQLYNFADISYFLLSGMDCWWESAAHGHNCGCVWSTMKIGVTNGFSGVFGLFRGMERICNENFLKCHWVVRRRVSSVPLVACSPAESVCPPGPEHAPPPLSELFPWQWCRGGRTWWSSLLLGKSVVEGEKRENVCVFTLCHVFLNLKLSHAAICQHGSVTLTPYWLNLTLFSPLVVLEYNSKKLISSDYKNV